MGPNVSPDSDPSPHSNRMLTPTYASHDRRYKPVLISTTSHVNLSPSHVSKLQYVNSWDKKDGKRIRKELGGLGQYNICKERTGDQRLNEIDALHILKLSPGCTINQVVRAWEHRRKLFSLDKADEGGEETRDWLVKNLRAVDNALFVLTAPRRRYEHI